MNRELDCRGLACPQPVIQTRKLIGELAPDEIEVIVDNQAAVENVSRFLANNGYRVTSDQKKENEWVVHAEKMQEASAAQVQSSAGGKTLVLVTTETLGRGDDELGRKLMETFIGTLQELGESLWRIVFLNGGVKLTCANGPVLDALKNLQAAGTDILVCGTCLMYYGLLEQKQIGETTNMMDVMTSLALAEKIIRP